MAQRVRRRQDDDRAARPPDPPLRHRRDRQRQLALQKPRRRSRGPRSPRPRNPGQLRRGERYRQATPLKGVKIGRRYGVKFERRLTVNVPIGIAAYLLGRKSLPDNPKSGSFDLEGTLLSASMFGFGFIGIDLLTRGGNIWIGMAALALGAGSGLGLV